MSGIASRNEEASIKDLRNRLAMAFIILPGISSHQRRHCEPVINSITCLAPAASEEP